MAKEAKTRASLKRKIPSPVRADIREETRSPSGNGFPIVGIGASAGGLDAFEQFFSHMPVDSGMAFVLIPHLDPTHKSILVDLLKRYTNMDIFQAEDGMKVRPNCVYIIPPNKDMSILHGELQLLEPVERRGLRHPIDFFFRSLAEDQGEKAVGIILSGTGTEGAQGIRAVKGEGGLALVQDVKTAKYDGMPESAIATGMADYVLPPDKMPEELLKFIKRPFTARMSPEPRPGGKAVDLLQKVYILIRAQTGHDFSLYKQNTILRRIEKRMAIHQIKNMADYVTYLR
jgi:two-component system CheB/CheR fusion protein